MFCPKCRSEYRQEFTVCSECNVSLVHTLYPESPPEFVEYEQILTTHSESDIFLLKSILDCEGITHFIRGEHVASYVWHAIPLRLMVRKDQVLKAIEILKHLDLSYAFGGLSNFDDKNNEEK